MTENKIKCCVCKNEIDAFCVLKKAKIAVNKPRFCSKFSFVAEKVRIKKQLPTIEVPSWFVDGDSRRKMRRKQRELNKQLQANGKAPLQLIQTADKVTATPVSYSQVLGNLPVKNDKHPLTGDLSRFTTTGSREE